jgi:protein-disulfide isomerase-like protein with CxxC motif
MMSADWRDFVRPHEERIKALSGQKFGENYTSKCCSSHFPLMVLTDALICPLIRLARPSGITIPAVIAITIYRSKSGRKVPALRKQMLGSSRAKCDVPWQ